jgi:ATPase subunit of ABC transporter with duplicated ATPase domains
MIAFKNFALRRGERLLLSKVDLTLHAGWRVGVIGRNGCGKSSLFADDHGRDRADRGDSTCPRAAHRQRRAGNAVAAGSGDRFRARRRRRGDA